MKKKMFILLFIVSCLAIMMAASTAMAGSYTFSGSSYIGQTGSTLAVQTSTNVTILYDGNSNGQTYGASSKNKAGDKVYATGGGQGSASGLYYQQNSTWVGSVNATSLVDPTSLFTAGSGWTAQ